MKFTNTPTYDRLNTKLQPSWKVKKYKNTKIQKFAGSAIVVNYFNTFPLFNSKSKFLDFRSWNEVHNII